MNERDQQPPHECLRGSEGRALLQAGEPKLIQAGDTVFRQGERVGHFLVLVRGTIELSRMIGANQVQLGTRGAGTILALLAALDGKPYAVNARALEDCSAVEISRDALFRLLQPEGRWSAALASDLAALTSRHLREASLALSNVLCQALRAPLRPGRLDLLDLARIQAEIHAWPAAALAA